MTNYPRSVYFKDGKAVCTSFPPAQYDSMEVIMLPSDHYDFPGPVKVAGKTKEEIEKDVSALTVG